MTTSNKGNQTPPIDFEQVMERVGNDKDFLFDLINIYIEDFPDKLNTLKRSIAEKKFQTMQEAAHYLKGSSANLSLTFLYRESLALENAAIEKNISKAEKALKNLMSEFDRLNQFISKEKQD